MTLNIEIILRWFVRCVTARGCEVQCDVLVHRQVKRAFPAVDNSFSLPLVMDTYIFDEKIRFS